MQTRMLTLFIVIGAGLIAIPTITFTEVNAKDKVYCGTAEGRDNTECFEKKSDCKNFAADKCIKVDNPANS